MSSKPETQNNKDPGRQKGHGTMPSKDKVKEQSRQTALQARPFTVFFVSPETPEEVHAETIMATGCEDALEKAAGRHGNNTVLHVRGIGDNGFTTVCEDEAQKAATGNKCQNHFPGARFINGKFHQVTISDERLLESLSD